MSPSRGLAPPWKNHKDLKREHFHTWTLVLMPAPRATKDHVPQLRSAHPGVGGTPGAGDGSPQPGQAGAAF